MIGLTRRLFARKALGCVADLTRCSCPYDPETGKLFRWCPCKRGKQCVSGKCVKGRCK